jgi:hypothetical protein
MEKFIEGVTAAITAIKSLAKYLLIPSGVIMILPDDWLLRFRLLDVKNTAGMWVSIVFWICLSIVAIDSLSKLYKFFNTKRIAKKTLKSLEKGFETLNPSERVILYLIFTNDSYEFDIKNASVRKLEALKYITRPSVGTIFGFSYTLQPWVNDYLHSHTDYFNGIRQELANQENER